MKNAHKILLILGLILIVVVVVIKVLYNVHICTETIPSGMPTSRQEVVPQIYSESDFNAIISGQSTFEDVHAELKEFTFYLTSYGRYSEFLLEDGRYMSIKFYGSELIVGELKIIDEPLFP